jgi:hypothetical protein
MTLMAITAVAHHCHAADGHHLFAPTATTPTSDHDQMPIIKRAQEQ